MKYAFWAGAGALLLAVGGVLALDGCTPGGRAGDARSGMIPNALCHVCHIPFATEKLAATHARKKVWCKECHGPSMRHMEDEKIGVTPPEIVYKPSEIAPLCAKCHKPKRHPKLSEEKRAALLASAAKAQAEITGRPASPAGACTDCHGSHWIPRKGPENP
jgi:hypothetical protein